MTQAEGLSGTLRVIEDETEGQSITVGEITQALNHRGFGPLMLVPAMVTILPTGAIPGIPGACGIFIVLVTGQMICGRHYPWMPGWLKNLSFDRQKFMDAIEKAKPAVTVIDRFVRPRLDFFSGPLMQRLIASFCFVLAILMAMVGFVPFLPAVISMPILFFALGLTSRDGIMTMAGFAFSIAAIVLVFIMSGGGGGEDRIHIRQPVFIYRSFTVNLDSFHP